MGINSGFKGLILVRNECDEVELLDGNVGMTLQKMCKSKHMSRDLTPSQAASFKPCFYRHVIYRVVCFIVEHCLQSRSYFKYQEYFRGASPKYPVPDKSKVLQVSGLFS